MNKCFNFKKFTSELSKRSSINDIFTNRSRKGKLMFSQTDWYHPLYVMNNSKTYMLTRKSNKNFSICSIVFYQVEKSVCQKTSKKILTLPHIIRHFAIDEKCEMIGYIYEGEIIIEKILNDDDNDDEKKRIALIEFEKEEKEKIKKNSYDNNNEGCIFLYFDKYKYRRIYFCNDTVLYVIDFTKKNPLIVLKVLHCEHGFYTSGSYFSFHPTDQKYFIFKVGEHQGPIIHEIYKYNNNNQVEKINRIDCWWGTYTMDFSKNGDKLVYQDSQILKVIEFPSFKVLFEIPFVKFFQEYYEDIDEDSRNQISLNFTNFDNNIIYFTNDVFNYKEISNPTFMINIRQKTHCVIFIDHDKLKIKKTNFGKLEKKKFYSRYLPFDCLLSIFLYLKFEDILSMIELLGKNFNNNHLLWKLMYKNYWKIGGESIGSKNDFLDRYIEENCLELVNKNWKNFSKK